MFRWNGDVIAGMSSGDLTLAGCAILDMGAGFRALPVDTDTKAPFPWLTRNGVGDATADATTLAQWLAVAGGAAGDVAIGIVPGAGFAILDDDTGELDLGRYGVSGTFTELTRRGRHAWIHLSDGRILRKSRLPDGAGDVITGNRAYSVISPSPGYTPLDIQAPMLDLPADSLLWTIAATKETLGTELLGVSEADRAEGHRLERRMLRSTEYGQGIRALISASDNWPKFFPTAQDTTESGRDFQLALAATHFLRDHPRESAVIGALLEKHSIKARNSRNPQGYINSVTDSAITSRRRRESNRLGATEKALMSKGVLDAKSLTKQTRSTAIEEAILRIAAGALSNGPVGESSWQRVPVDDLADVYHVSREAIRQRLVSLEERGVIERQTPAYRHDGRVRRDSLVRPINQTRGETR